MPIGKPFLFVNSLHIEIILLILTKNTASQVDTSRGVHIRRGSKDVYDCGPGDRVWRGGKCGVWGRLLDMFIVLRKAPFV